MQEAETRVFQDPIVEKSLGQTIGGALVRVALALVIIVSLLFISSPRKSEAFTLSGILREVAMESAVDKARNTPSQAFIALLQAAYVSTGVEINGATIIRAWQSAYRPRMGAYYAVNVPRLKLRAYRGKNNCNYKSVL